MSVSENVALYKLISFPKKDLYAYDIKDLRKHFRLMKVNIVKVIAYLMRNQSEHMGFLKLHRRLPTTKISTQDKKLNQGFIMSSKYL